MHGLTNDEMKMVMKVTNIYKHEKQILVLNLYDFLEFFCWHRGYKPLMILKYVIRLEYILL